MQFSSFTGLIFVLSIAGCGDDGRPTTDGGRDSGGGDAGRDAGRDAAGVDSGGMDSGGMDSGGMDAGGMDAGGMDAGGMDAGGTDGGTDAGGADAGGTDAGGTDAGGTDAGAMDAGSPDSAPTDAGPPPSGAYTVSPYDDMVRQIDLTDGMTISMTAITLAGFTVVGANGMAVHPSSGQVFVALRVEDDEGRTTRRLVTLDVASGIATDIGQLMGGGVASIAFDSTGTLYAVTGEMGTSTETLFTVNTGDATMTMFLALGNGDDGEAIGFNPVDGFLYHASGLGERVFESVNLATMTVSGLTLTGDDYGEATALVFDTSAGNFLGANIDGQIFRITTGGAVSGVIDLDHTAKGFALIP